MFQNTNQSLGSVREGTSKIVEFPYTDIASILQTSASCGCTVTEADRERSVLKASYTAKPVPPHLWGQGYYDQCLNITVTYTTIAEPLQSVTELLTFSVRVVK